MVDHDIIVGMGEIGSTIFKLLEGGLSKNLTGIDQDPAKNKSVGVELVQPVDNSCVDVLHVCIPYVNTGFIQTVLAYSKQFSPKEIVIHSTVKPGTTLDIQKKLEIPVVYSPVRGIHALSLIHI